MTEQNAPFAPDWASPPGDTIADLIEERGWTPAELAERMGYSAKHVNHLLQGNAALTEDAALRLEPVLGASADFWLTREARYRGRVARLKAARFHAEAGPGARIPAARERAVRAAPQGQRGEAAPRRHAAGRPEVIACDGNE